MSLLLHNGNEHPSNVQMYDDVGRRLVEMGHAVTVHHGSLEGASGSFSRLLSNEVMPLKVRQKIETCGGVLLSRAESMAILQEAGLPVMKWGVARDREMVRSFFESWKVERLLLKRSFTYAGDGISVFDQSFAESDDFAKFEWDFERDIFCAEVNPEEGEVYKAELFNGEMIISWRSEAPPLRELMEGSSMNGVKGAYGERALFGFPEELEEKLRALSAALTKQGVGYVSLDLMKDLDGRYQVIEINLSMIATWWTGQFDAMKDRFAKAISNWVKTG